MVVALVAAAAGIWLTSSLGFWQLRRAAEKEALQAATDAAARAAPVAPSAEDLRDPSRLLHRHIFFQGRWIGDRAVYLDNRPHAGQAGFYVLMPLRIETPIATQVIVNRGWTPRNPEDRSRIGRYDTAPGAVTVQGIVLSDEQRFMELAAPQDRQLNAIWQNFDFDAYARANGEAVARMIVREDAGPSSAAAGPAAAASGDGLMRDWPDRGAVLQGQIDRHYGYAFQWFALAATLALLLLFQVYRWIRHVRTIAH